MNEVDTQRSAFVTGATGCIGSALVAKLVHDGWRVVALVRNRNHASHLPERIEIVEASLADREQIATAMQDCRTVFHLAAKVHAPQGTPLKDFERENVAGTRNVVAAAIENKVERFIFFSTVAVYGESEKIQDETRFPRPATAYGSSKFDAEQIVLGEAELNATVLRLPVVYGARDRGNVARLIQAIRQNRYFLVGDGQNLKSMVAVENVVDAALLVALDERAIGQTYNVTDGRPYSQEEIAATIAELLGRRKPAKLPRWLLMLAGKTGDFIETLFGVELPISSDRIQKLSSNTVFSAAKIKRELEFEPRVDLREGLIQAIKAISNSRSGI